MIDTFVIEMKQFYLHMVWSITSPCEVGNTLLTFTPRGQDCFEN